METESVNIQENEENPYITRPQAAKMLGLRAQQLFLWEKNKIEGVPKPFILHDNYRSKRYYLVSEIIEYKNNIKMKRTY